ARLAVDPQAHVDVVVVAYLVRADQGRAKRRERLERLAHRALLVAALAHAHGDVQRAGVAPDVLHRVLALHAARGLADDEGQLALVVEAAARAIGQLDRVARAGDRRRRLEEEAQLASRGAGGGAHRAHLRDVGVVVGRGGVDVHRGRQGRAQAHAVQRAGRGLLGGRLELRLQLVVIRDKSVHEGLGRSRVPARHYLSDVAHAVWSEDPYAVVVEHHEPHRALLP